MTGDESGGLAEQPKPGRLARGLAGVTVFTMTLPLGVVGAALAAAALPYAEDLAGLVEAELRGKPQLVGEGALAAARAARPDITDEELWRELAGDDELRALMMRVVDAARHTARPDKLRWLGEILGQVAVDKDRLDEGIVLTAALNDLEAPHAVVLQVLGEPSPHELRNQQPGGWLATDVAARVGLDDGIVRACLGTITRHGLARDARGPFSGEVYVLTALGHALLTVMHASRGLGSEHR